jgi:hypothetical protein
LAADELDLAAELPGALERGEIVFGFQPIVDATTGETMWAEALIRWLHPRRYVGPGEFLPVAERLGLMPSHQWIYETISATARTWRSVRTDSVITANAPPVLDELFVDVVDGLLATGSRRSRWRSRSTGRRSSPETPSSAAFAASGSRSGSTTTNPRWRSTSWRASPSTS